MRLSPDHGTAKSIIGKNKANPLSLLKCINFKKTLKNEICKEIFRSKFLIDKNIIKKIINLTNVYKRNVLEIGPGLGALTDEILDRNPNCLYIIEKDFNLAKKHKEKYSEIKK